MSLKNFFNKIIGQGHHNRDDNGETPLYHAARTGSLRQVKQLLAKGADPNAANAKGLTPLHQAAYWGETDIVELLLKSGADPKADNGKGWTPLHSAALAAGLSGRKKIMNLLIKAGADPVRKDKNGWTPGDYAALWKSGDPLLPKMMGEYEKDVRPKSSPAARITAEIRKQFSWPQRSLTDIARAAFSTPGRPVFQSSRRAAMHFHLKI